MRRSDRIKKKNKPITPVKKQPKKETPAASKVTKAKRGGIYDAHYKKLLLIPFIILALALITIGTQYATTGDFINRGVSLKGGLQVSVPSEDLEPQALTATLSTIYPDNDIEVRGLEEAGSQIAITISADIDTNQESVNAFIDIIEEETSVSQDEYSIETIGSSLGNSFFKQTMKALFIAFLFMGMVVFLYFGEGKNTKWLAAGATIVATILMYSGSVVMNILALLIGLGLLVLYTKESIPSVAVILAAFSDIVVTLAVINLLGIKIGTAGIAAFLMLIGYSVDTDILLSTRVLKRTGGTVYDRTINALKTGLTMNFTTMAAVLIALFVAESAIITQIMTILFIGLIADMINTWLQNAGILRWHLERKEASRK